MSSFIVSVPNYDPSIMQGKHHNMATTSTGSSSNTPPTKKAKFNTKQAKKSGKLNTTLNTSKQGKTEFTATAAQQKTNINVSSLSIGGKLASKQSDKMANSDTNGPSNQGKERKITLLAANQVYKTSVATANGPSKQRSALQVDKKASFSNKGKFAQEQAIKKVGIHNTAENKQGKIEPIAGQAHKKTAISLAACHCTQTKIDAPSQNIPQVGFSTKANVDILSGMDAKANGERILSQHPRNMELYSSSSESGNYSSDDEEEPKILDLLDMSDESGNDSSNDEDSDGEDGSENGVQAAKADEICSSSSEADDDDNGGSFTKNKASNNLTGQAKAERDLLTPCETESDSDDEEQESNIQAKVHNIPIQQAKVVEVYHIDGDGADPRMRTEFKSIPTQRAKDRTMARSSSDIGSGRSEYPQCEGEGTEDGSDDDNESINYPEQPSSSSISTDSNTTLRNPHNGNRKTKVDQLISSLLTTDSRKASRNLLPAIAVTNKAHDSERNDASEVTHSSHHFGSTQKVGNTPATSSASKAPAPMKGSASQLKSDDIATPTLIKSSLAGKLNQLDANDDSDERNSPVAIPKWFSQKVAKILQSPNCPDIMEYKASCFTHHLLTC
jgi:hypothetical protein